MQRNECIDIVMLLCNLLDGDEKIEIDMHHIGFCLPQQGYIDGCCVSLRKFLFFSRLHIPCL